MDWLRESVTKTARRIAARETSPVEAVDRAISAIEQVNPRINALVADRFDHARAEARIAEARIADRDAAELPPLFGVPCVVGESIAVHGCPHSAGVLERGVRVAHADATAVRRLKDAGAIVLGVTNVAEHNHGFETDNRVYGATSNPWRVGYTAGGSSGGDASLVATGAVGLAIAVDQNGGARIPAALCGVMAHKPSGGMVPTTGLWPIPPGRSRRHVSLAPVARFVDDLDLALRVIAGEDEHDPSTSPLQLRERRSLDLLWKRVMVCDDPAIVGARTDREVRMAVSRAASALATHGAEVEEWRPQAFNDVSDIWLAMVHEAYGLHRTFSQTVGEGTHLPVLLELIRLGAGRSAHTLPTLAFAAVERITKGSYARIQRFCAEGRRLRDRINAMLGDGGVLLMPTFPSTAFRQGRGMLRPRHFLHAAIHNVLELPATTLPAGLGKDGLPLAVQIVAAHGRDDIALGVAEVLERDGFGWTPPPLLKSKKSRRVSLTRVDASKPA